MSTFSLSSGLHVKISWDRKAVENIEEETWFPKIFCGRKLGEITHFEHISQNKIKSENDFFTKISWAGKFEEIIKFNFICEHETC